MEIGLHRNRTPGVEHIKLEPRQSQNRIDADELVADAASHQEVWNRADDAPPIGRVSRRVIVILARDAEVAKIDHFFEIICVRAIDAGRAKSTLRTRASD